MAVDSGYQKKRKKRKKNPTKKLLIGEQVEVLYNDEGLSGSWHSGTVIGCGEYTRVVEHTNLLCEDNKLKLQETIQVSSPIEGLHEKVTLKFHRNNIRPLPPYYNIQEQEIKYGLCVDVLLDDVWWEGVVFDRMEKSDERLIFFPDEGDQQMVSVDKLRVTQEWNELTGHWKLRGTWLFLQVLQPFEQEEGLPVSVREIWFDLRITDSFMDKIGVWIFGRPSDWNALVSGLIRELRSAVFDVVAPLKEFSAIGDIDSISKTGTTENDVQIIDCNHSSILALEYRASKIVCSENCDSIVDINKKNKSNKTTSCDNKVDENNIEMGESWKYVDLGAAYFPDAVKNWASTQLTEKPSVILKAKKHLIFLGWKIAVRHTKTITRIRYISPKGKSYYSLKTACSALLGEAIKKETCKNGNKNGVRSQNLSVTIAACNDDADSQSLSKNIYTCASAKSKSLSKNIEACSNGKPQSLWKTDSHCNFEDSDNVFPVCDGLEPENFPESPLVYKTYADMSRKKGNNEFSLDLNMMRLKVRKHLKYMGWKFWIKVKHRKELFITSPCGKCFKSLYLACDEYLKEESPNNNGKCIISILPDYRENKRERIFTGRKVIPNRSKNVSVQGIPRTLLSSLIDSNLVQSMQKVNFIRKRDGKILKTGQITRDGIKCTCCNRVFNLSNFEVHAGSTYRRAAANIFLEDGRSLLHCQREMINCKTPTDFKRIRMKCDYSRYQSDSICSVCHDVGELVLCDYCPSSFHLSCLGLKIVPDGKWFCPACRCGICGTSEFNCNTEQFTENTMLYCDQCEHEYHVGCVRKKGVTILSSCLLGNWFCSNECSKIFHRLRRLLGVSKPTSLPGLSCTILRSSRENGVDNLQFGAETLIEHESKLCVALNVMHECFVDITEPRTRSDFVADLLFNRESELRRLNLYGFYTMLLEKDDEPVSVAAFRVHGDKVAEMPFIGTCVKYRRQGMCRLLINQLEKLLLELGVKTFVLPAVPQLLETWASFGFKTMNSSDRLNFLEHTFVNFQDTKLCWKVLSSMPIVEVEHKGAGKELTIIFDSRTQGVDSEIHGKVVKEAEPTEASLSAMHDHLDTSNQSHGEIEKVVEEVEPTEASLFAAHDHLDTSNQTQGEIEKFVKEVEPTEASLFATHDHLDTSNQSQGEIEKFVKEAEPTDASLFTMHDHLDTSNRSQGEIGKVVEEVEPTEASLFATHDHLDTSNQSLGEMEKVVEEIEPTEASMFATHDHLDTSNQSQGEIVKVVEEVEPTEASLFATHDHLDTSNQSQGEIEKFVKEAEPTDASLFATHDHLDTSNQSQSEIEKVVEEVEPTEASLFAMHDHLDTSNQSHGETEISPTSICINPPDQHEGKHKYREDAANYSPILALKAHPRDQNLKPSTEYPKPAFIHSGMLKPFKHVYKRRKLSANA